MSSFSPRPRSKRPSVSGTAEKPGVHLGELVERYLAVSGGYGKPAALAAFGLPQAETERAFNSLDEDYMISRFLHFHNDSGESFQINGFPQTHVAIDAAIQSML